jgi:cell division transport system ATP-binding protein
MIQLYNVTKEFGSVRALSQVNLHVRKGEFVLLSGPSGAGKTTLLRTIFAAERPDDGHIVLAGRNISRLPRQGVPQLRRSIGVVFQDFKLLSTRTALRNVAVALEIRGLPRKKVRDRSLLALGAVGLESRVHTPVACLSGGEQQRVAIARAMVGSPSIVLADEPTGNLDPERSHDILDLLQLEAQRGTTVLLATHDPMVVQNAAAHRVILMDQGTIVGCMAGSQAPISPPRDSEHTDRPQGPADLQHPAEALA